MVFVVEFLRTNILPTNEVIIDYFYFYASASSNHKNNIDEPTKYSSTTNVLTPRNYLLYDTYFLSFRTLPRSLLIAVPIVMLCYILINIAYFGVLSYCQILASDTIALVTFCSRTIHTS